MPIEQILLVAVIGVAGFLIVYNIMTPHQPSAQPDWHDVLGVGTGATPSEIDNAYERLVADLEAPAPPAFAAENRRRRALVDSAYRQACRSDGE